MTIPATAHVLGYAAGGVMPARRCRRPHTWLVPTSAPMSGPPASVACPTTTSHTAVSKDPASPGKSTDTDVLRSRISVITSSRATYRQPIIRHVIWPAKDVDPNASEHRASHLAFCSHNPAHSSFPAIVKPQSLSPRYRDHTRDLATQLETPTSFAIRSPSMPSPAHT